MRTENLKSCTMVTPGELNARISDLAVCYHDALCARFAYAMMHGSFKGNMQTV
jgi:hypothetical protein